MLVGIVAAFVLAPQATLTPAEQRAGWQLLFDGKTTAGWRSYRGREVRPGWRIENGALICADPHQAGDIISVETFDQFELSIEVKYGRGQNSGVMFLVTEEYGAPWMSGPELQIVDHGTDEGAQKTGWLYDLYAGSSAPAKVDHWNQLRLVVRKGKSATYVNGVLIYEFDLASQDFADRVARSKFSAFPNFGKAERGHIALQGDHGVVAFRNIKIRPLN